ncbi:sensor histidine kinase [Salinadaptatus halalkaliphilus]|uniref:histidine kinase n=1 Tax=Salinadaptatus halalkaliphilus TaxID=2419781 RepID=A0A4S3TRA4_9EURY|nr:sensor histidine kinase [Salinadaptatus halalkaliphilus]THE65883.1 sensor histidine kinase [Salinadaptatus halalkaliphilus]
MRIAYRFFLVFLLVVLVSGAVLFLTFDAHQSDVTANAETSVADHANISASMLDDRIREQQRSVAIAAGDEALTEHGTDAQSDALEAFVDTSAFEGATVVDDTGEVQAIVSGDDAADVEGADLSKRPYVDRALAGERYVSEPFVAETGYEIVTISMPIYDDDEIVGALNGAYHLDETELFDPLSGAPREGITVETTDQTLYSDGDQFEETIDHSETLETVEWTVTAHRDRAEVSATTNQLAIFQLVSGLTLLGSISAFGLWVYCSNIRRIGRLHDRVRALEARDYESRPSIDGSGEWGRIDAALESLASSLARREQMLLVLNRILRHNLRNTLNVVAGRATDLESTLEGERSDTAADIRVATDELVALADRARMTESLLDPIEEPVPRTDLAALVRERVDAFERTPDDGGDGGDETTDRTERHRQLESITVVAPETAVATCGEEVAVAIDELLANAAEHAGPNASVEVTVETDEQWVRVRIDDDGPGIPPVEGSAIASDRPTSQVNHTGGIGLWLVNWIVSRYDGRLSIPSVEDQPPTDSNTNDGPTGDSGTTVMFELPRGSDSTAD